MFAYLLSFVWERAQDARTLVMLTYLPGAIRRREVVIFIILEWRMQIRSFCSLSFVIKMVILVTSFHSILYVSSLAWDKVDCALAEGFASDSREYLICMHSENTRGFTDPCH